MKQARIRKSQILDHGRKTIKKSAALIRSDAIVAFSFGKRESVADDVINRALARLVKEAFKVHHVPVYVNRGIDDFLGCGTSPVFIIPTSSDITAIRGMLVTVKASGKKSILIIAHSDQVTLLKAAARSLGFETVSIIDCAHIGYDSKSLVWWTRSSLLSRFYSRICYAYYYCRGWIKK